MTLEQAIEAVRERLAALEEAPGVTLSTMADVFQSAIANGAPLYNAGDANACYRLYRSTALDIIRVGAAMPGPLPEPVVTALDDLVLGVQRAEAESMATDAAWCLRHVFDKHLVIQQGEVRKLVGLWMLAQNVLARGDFEGALSILRTAHQQSAALLASPIPASDGAHVTWLAWLLLGHVELLCGEPQIAMDHILQVATLAPRTLLHVPDLSKLGSMAEVLWGQVAAVDTETPDGERLAATLTAYLHLQSNDAPRAVDQLTHLLAGAPTYEAALVLLAVAADRVAHPTDAGREVADDDDGMEDDDDDVPRRPARDSN